MSENHNAYELALTARGGRVFCPCPNKSVISQATHLNRAYATYMYDSVLAGCLARTETGRNGKSDEKRKRFVADLACWWVVTTHEK